MDMADGLEKKIKINPQIHIELENLMQNIVEMKLRFSVILLIRSEGTMQQVAYYLQRAVDGRRKKLKNQPWGVSFGNAYPDV